LEDGRQKTEDENLNAALSLQLILITAKIKFQMKASFNLPELKPINNMQNRDAETAMGNWHQIS